MNKTKNLKSTEALYETPQMDVIYFENEDVITSSGVGDKEQGEWDPQ